ncbi:uncharacterized protein LOC121868104 [Homarus americanus]|uniref:uncharacterized protein LOC121868104 n=1 Tax=Homarus americanus TaxID=6706 RepID=UPI001C492A39|nr:uncharacterized protein LOC121868104 [Homarus americanus]
MDDDQDEDLVVAMVAATVAALDFSDCATLDKEMVLQASLEDPVYQLLVVKVLADNWHSCGSQEIACLKPFYNVRDRLSTSCGQVTYTFNQGCVCLVISEGLRHQVAANLHAGHQGLDSMLRRARQTVYWPGLEVNGGEHDPAGGTHYLAYADRLTGWLEIAHFPSGTSSGKIMAQLRRYFTGWGAPEQISTDGGTNLVSEEMVEFFWKWSVAVRLSSAQYPQSNGRAEAAVKTAKRVLLNNTGANGSLDEDKVSLALLQYLNTPLRGADKSPAHLATGRQLHDGVPQPNRISKLTDIEDSHSADENSR